MNLAAGSICVAAFSGCGIVRKQNEDNVSIDGEVLEHEKIHVCNFDPTVDHLILVADGMGGHARGELASHITVQEIGRLWSRSRAEFEPIEATRTANKAVYNEMARNPSLRGMGATIVGAHVCSTDVQWFNLGDSRGYVFRSGTLNQFSTDHVPRGTTANGLTRSHNVTQSVGGAKSLVDVWPAVGRLHLRKTDTLLFCTDGLTDAVSDKSIGQALEFSNSLGDASVALVKLAEENGAPDNLSFVLVRI